MNEAELFESHELIKETDENTEQAFRAAIENVELADLAAVSDYLGAGVAAESAWEDYANAFEEYEWYQFCEAYEHVMYRSFSLS